jgi:hypothetical protein
VGSGNWIGYHDAQEGREPREVLTEVLRAFDAEGRVGSAVDLGCSDGTDSLALERGWDVLSIDAQADAIRRLRARHTDDVAARSTTVVSPMHAVDLPPTDLVFASFSVPFCPRRRSQTCGFASGRRSARVDASRASCSATATRGRPIPI